MKIIPLHVIRRKVAARPEGYYEDVVLSGKVVNDEFLEIDDASYAALCKKYREGGNVDRVQKCC